MTRPGRWVCRSATSPQPAGASSRHWWQVAGPMDLGRITGDGPPRWFAGVVSAGFDAAVNARANTWRWPRGRSRYNLAMLREFATFRAIDYTVTDFTASDDGDTWRQSAMLISRPTVSPSAAACGSPRGRGSTTGSWTCSSSNPCRGRPSWQSFPKVFSGRPSGPRSGGPEGPEVQDFGYRH